MRKKSASPLLFNCVCPVLIILLLGLCSTSYSQEPLSKVDTVKIYKNHAGVRFYIYMRSWFFGYGVKNSYSYFPWKVNKQDSLVIEHHPPRFFKVLNRNGKLLFEGQTEGFDTEFYNDVRFYYRNGTLKRIEHWDNKYENKDCPNLTISMNDAPGHEGIWYYFRKNGSLRKKIEYYVEVETCEPIDYCLIKKITCVARNGKEKFKVEKTYCWSE